MKNLKKEYVHFKSVLLETKILGIENVQSYICTMYNSTIYNWKFKDCQHNIFKLDRKQISENTNFKQKPIKQTIKNLIWLIFDLK